MTSITLFLEQIPDNVCSMEAVQKKVKMKSLSKLLMTEPVECTVSSLVNLDGPPDFGTVSVTSEFTVDFAKRNSASGTFIKK
jgi:hypothetical protein